VRHNARGFSLVELMVAITIGLILSAAAVSVFVGSRHAYEATSGTAAVTEGGRYALNFIEESARAAGFVACNHATINSSISNLNVASNLAYDFRFGVSGFEAVGTAPGAALTLPAVPPTGVTSGAANSNWSADLDGNAPTTGDFTGQTALAAGTANGNQVTGSDVLVLRSSLPQAMPVYLTANTNGAGTLNVNSLGVAPALLQAGQIAAVSDCTKSVAFQITGLSATTVTFGAGGAPGNATTTLTLPFVAGSMVAPLTTSVYYIGRGSDGDAALRRLNLNGATNGPGVFSDEELVPDIENMQVLYGVATGGGLVPTQYVTANQVTDFGTVVSIKVAVLAASQANTGMTFPQAAFNLLGTLVTAPADSRKRKVFQVTIGLRNALD
jgi:type IV pilus assembly protein PilW